MQPLVLIAILMLSLIGSIVALRSLLRRINHSFHTSSIFTAARLQVYNLLYRLHFRATPQLIAADPPLMAATLVAPTEPHRRRTFWFTLLELGLIVIWAVWVGQAYLDPNPDMWPNGGELGMAVQSHFPWTWLPKCGACALWNGWVNGGSPTVADVYGAVAHPLVVAAVIAFGLINGAKFIMLTSLVLVGIAQWWLAKVMGLSWLPRLWSAAIAIVGGHIAGRMDAGLVIFVFSIASTSLLLAPAIQLVQTPRRRTAIILGLLLGLALLSGQGYMQVTIVFGLMPALLIFALGSKFDRRRVWKEFAVSGLIAILIAAVLWIPMVHFWPNVAKDSDPGLGSVQPIQYLPLNLVINDHDFYNTTDLAKTALVFLYVNYIGWAPILLAVAAVRLAPRNRRRLLLFFGIAIGFVYILASGLPIIVLRDAFGVQVTGIRFPSIIASLAVPLILALAAWGVDLMLKLGWPVKYLKLPLNRLKTLSFKPIAVLMPVLLLAAIIPVYEFSKTWLITVPAIPPQNVLSIMRTNTSQWVYPPFGEAYWLPYGLNANLKMVTITRPWQWKDRVFPDYSVEASWKNVGPATGPVIAEIDGLAIFTHPGIEYAYIQIESKTVPCQAQALGGDIDVNCQSDEDGSLIVEENNWDGWYVKRDGVSADLGTGQWLSTAAPAGMHHYEFRYRPWDVPLGLAISLIGLGWAVWLWIRGSPKNESV